MRNILKKYHKYVVFVLFIFIIGLLLGFFYYHFLDEEVKNNLINTIAQHEVFKYNSIFKDLIIMSLILVLSFFVIGIPLGIFYLGYECLSFGFLLSIFYASYKLKGLFYVIIYILINRLLTIILIVIFLYKIINIGRLIIGFFIYKKDASIKDRLISNFKNSLYILLFVLIINIFLYFISPIIFRYLSFLIK